MTTNTQRAENAADHATTDGRAITYALLAIADAIRDTSSADGDWQRFRDALVQVAAEAASRDTPPGSATPTDSWITCDRCGYTLPIPNAVRKGWTPRAKGANVTTLCPTCRRRQ